MLPTNCRYCRRHYNRKYFIDKHRQTKKHMNNYNKNFNDMDNRLNKVMDDIKQTIIKFNIINEKYGLPKIED